MYFSKITLFAAIFVLVRAGVDDCTVTQVGEITDVLKKCDNILVRDLNIPSTGDLPVFNLNGQNLTFQGKTTFDARFQDETALLTITGNNFLVKIANGGNIDGQGALYWDGKGIRGGVKKPVLIKIDRATNGILNYLNLLNCPQACAEISRSNGISINGWTIDVSAGEKDCLGADTHGFTFKNSTNSKIQNSRITTQGECLSINQGDSLTFFSIDCIGSQGVTIRPEWTFANYIRNISFTYVFIHKGRTGIRILTSPFQAEGTISDINFKTIQLTDILNVGIDIRENYDSNGSGLSNIQIDNLNITTVTGYMNEMNSQAVHIYCSNNGCSDWYWSGVDIKKATNSNYCNYIPNGFKC